MANQSWQKWHQRNQRGRFSGGRQICGLIKKKFRFIKNGVWNDKMADPKTEIPRLEEDLGKLFIHFHTKRGTSFRMILHSSSYETYLLKKPKGRNLPTWFIFCSEWVKAGGGITPTAKFFRPRFCGVFPLSVINMLQLCSPSHPCCFVDL